jgi:hypothetical protein
MSLNRVVNLTKIHRVVASNATKLNKGGAKRKMVLVDEYDDEDEERFQGIILLNLKYSIKVHFLLIFPFML